MTELVVPTPTPDATVDAFTRAFLRELNFGQGVELAHSSVNDQYLALARTVRQYLMSRWLETQRRQRHAQAKSVAYLSAEFLLGRQLGNALLGTGLEDVAAEALRGLDIDIATLRDAEVEPGLGNGGLVRQSVQRLRTRRHQQRRATTDASQAATTGRPTKMPSPRGPR